MLHIIELSKYLQSVNLQQELIKRISLFHEICGQPATGTPLEGILHKSLSVCGIKSEWNSGSHNQEKDMILEIQEEKLNISLKGCKENSMRISYSSYRTTSANTLEDKIKIIERLDSQLDMMLVFSRLHSGKNIFPEYYKIYLINPEYLNPYKFQWKETLDKTGKISGWRTSKNEWNINQGFVQAMSGQLWVDIAKENLDKYPDMIVNLMEIRI